MKKNKQKQTPKKTVRPNKTKNAKSAKKKKNNFLKINEQKFLDTVNTITKKLAYKFKFGYHEIEDMKQQIYIFALEGLKNYDNKRPLENFLWTHVRNRLFNYKRDNYQRPSPPCLTCPLFDPKFKASSSGCKKFHNKSECELYASWEKRNSSKKNLMYLTGIENVKDYGDSFRDKTKSVLENISNKEIIKLLEENLINDERIIYLKLKTGSKVSKTELTLLKNKITILLQEQNNV
jgi:hypothetical protein